MAVVDISMLSKPEFWILLALFWVLQPGALLQLPTRIPFQHAKAFFTERTSLVDAAVHTAIFALVIGSGIIIPGKFDMNNKAFLTKVALFFALSPGVIVEIPPGRFFSNKTSFAAITVHTALYAVVSILVKGMKM